MKVSMFLDTFTPKMGPGDIVDVARAAEDSGFHGIWVSEHAVFFEHYEPACPYTPDGSFSVVPGTGMLDPFVTLAYVAGATTRLLLGTAIVILAERNPVHTAKAASDLDYLSGGRVRLGVGLGWSAEEYEALGVPFARRGARTDEYLEVMRRLWEEPVASFNGEFYDLPPCSLFPKAVRRPHVPVYLAAGARPMGERARERAAEHAVGCIGVELTPDLVEQHRAALQAPLESRGRRPADFEMVVGPPAAWSPSVRGELPSVRTLDPSLLERYAAAGVTELTLLLGASTGAATVEQVRTFGAAVVETAAAL